MPHRVMNTTCRWGERVVVEVSQVLFNAKRDLVWIGSIAHVSGSGYRVPPIPSRRVLCLQRYLRNVVSLSAPSMSFHA
jgi:hypothetical protein